MRWRALATAAVAAALAVAVPIVLAEPSERGDGALLGCVAPTDVAGIDRALAGAGSPLAGWGRTIVARSHAVGLDPRALVAIAAHETGLASHGPAQTIRNPFGLGPGWTFPDYGAAIDSATEVLADGYLAEGRVTIPAIGAKWAPVGAANDPTDLNSAWPGGVARYYAELGGDPSAAVLFVEQTAVCDSGAAGADARAPGPEGPPVVTAWAGRTPRIAGRAPRHGADPDSGRPATIAGFVFPLAVPQGTPVAYDDGFADLGAPGCNGRPWSCSVTLAHAGGELVVAPAAGRLRAASPAERQASIGFWIERPGAERIGLGPLASYLPGIADGLVVAPGQPLGRAPERLAVAWTRGATWINPYPLLGVTRAPS